MIETDPAMLDRLLRRATPGERAEILGLTATDSIAEPWRAQPGAQAQAMESAADITGYGGAAGGGKSDLIAGLSLTRHRRSLILRRQKAQTDGIVQRISEIMGTMVGFNRSRCTWRVAGTGTGTGTGGERLIEFGGLDGPHDHHKWQGRAHDLIAYDEVTEMREAQVRFTMGWARTSDPAQRARVLMTFNPPTTAEGRWVLDFFAPWLDRKHPHPAEPGELRWFTTIRGRDVEVPRADPFVIFRGEPLYDFDPADFGAEKIVTPRSRTFVPSRVTDNLFYMRTGYIDTLQAMPEPLRSQMLNGDFAAGVEDDDWQVIPTAWIDAAMARWHPREWVPEMDSMGVDVAVGGRDAFVISCRHGSWFAPLIRVPGREIPQDAGGPITAGHVIRHRRDRAVVHVDVIGWGLTTANFLTENGVQTIAVNAASASGSGTADGRLKFVNVRAEMVWRLREALDPQGPEPVALPDDPSLRADLAAYHWSATARGILVRSKDEMKTLLGRSPDAGDAVCLANFRSMKIDMWEDIRRERRRGADTAEDLYRELYEESAEDLYRDLR